MCTVVPLYLITFNANVTAAFCIGNSKVKEININQLKAVECVTEILLNCSIILGVPFKVTYL